MAFAPAASADIEVEARSVIVPPPSAAVATWKKLEKDVPVEALPLLVIVAEYEVLTPTTAEVGRIAPVVRLG